ncbi:MAG: squalene/phytoene synthase family protein [Pseudomonadota bacterium]
MNTFRQRHPLLMKALPARAGSPFERARRGDDPFWNDNEDRLREGHADTAALMQSARNLGGELMERQLRRLWPDAKARDLALARGLGVALWLTELLLNLREDAARGLTLPPRDAMATFLVDEDQLREGRHDFALRRLAAHLAEQAAKVLQGSAPLGLSAPLTLRLRLRWTMLHAGFVLEAMRRDPNAPFIKPTLPPREALRLLWRTLFPRGRGMRGGGSGCAC